MNGFFNIAKPAGMTSAAVVAVIRRITGEKRVGHAGTLDPDAAGVLPIMIGKATRLFEYLVDKEKEYVAVAAFGSATDTQDASGTVTETGDRYPNREAVESACRALTGEVRQRPSVYSAIKVGGKPLYARARKGETPEVPERTVRIDRIEVLREMPEHGWEIHVQCGRGTYIRTLCHDMGKICGCPAHMRCLTRTRSGFFNLEESVTLEEIRTLGEEGRLSEKLLAPDQPIRHLPRTDIPERYARKVAAGAALELPEESRGLQEGGVTRIYLRDAFWGIAERREDLLVWKAQIAPEKENRTDESYS